MTSFSYGTDEGGKKHNKYEENIVDQASKESFPKL